MANLFFGSMTPMWGRSKEEFAQAIDVDLAWLGIAPAAVLRQSGRFAFKTGQPSAPVTGAALALGTDRRWGLVPARRPASPRTAGASTRKCPAASRFRPVAFWRWQGRREARFASQHKRFKEQLNRTHRFGRLGAGYLAGGHRTDNGR
jgi:hypothetical protein